MDELIEIDEPPSLFGMPEHREGYSQLIAGAVCPKSPFQGCPAKGDHDLWSTAVARDLSEDQECI